MRSSADRVIPLIIVLTSILSSTAARTQPCSGSVWDAMLPTPTPASLLDIWYAGPADITAVGDGGTVLNFDGSSWQTVDTGFDIEPSGVWGAAGHVYIVGETGACLHYNGSVWESIPVGTTADVYGVWASGPNDVYAMAADSVYRYNGSTWSSIGQVPTLAGLFFDIDGAGPDDVYVASYIGLHHYDGVGWTLVLNGGEATMALHLLSSSDIYAVTDGSRIHHFDGVSWTNLASFGGGIFPSGLWGPTGNDLYMSTGDGEILHWNGTSFNSTKVVSPYSLNAIHGTSAGDIRAVGRYGAIAHFDGVQWTISEDFTDMKAVWSTGPDKAFVVGGDGVIRHYDGSSVTDMPSGTTSPMFDVWGASPTSVFAGTQQDVLHYDGVNWSSTGFPDTYARNIWGFASNDVYVAGGNAYHVFHFNGAGWTNVYTTSVSMAGLWGSATDDMWVAPQFQSTQFFHFDGVGWGPVAVPTGDYNDIWGRAADDIYAVGKNGLVTHYDGVDWTTVPGAPVEWFSRIDGSGANMFVLAGTKVYHFDGTTFTEMVTGAPPTRTFVGVWASDNCEAFFVGPSSLIYRLSDSPSSAGPVRPAAPMTLLPNSPNPFTEATTLRVTLESAQPVSVDIFDVAGRRVDTIDAGVLSAGDNEIRWTARDRDGLRLRSGVYFYRVTTPGGTMTQKMVLLK